MTAMPLPPSAQHWYRQKWPWLLIAGPALVVLASLATLWIAAATDDGVISDDYYKRGLMINRELARSTRAEAMHVGALLRVAPDGAASVALSGFADAAAAPAYVRVHLARPTRAGQDRIVTLTRGPQGAYVGVIAPRPEGRWLVAIEADDWRLPAVAVTDGLVEVRMGTSRSLQ